MNQPATPAFTLTPPEVLAPVPVEAAREAVPLQPELRKQVDDQLPQQAHETGHMPPHTEHPVPQRLHGIQR